LQRAGTLQFAPATRDEETVAARIRFRMTFTPKRTPPPDPAATVKPRAPVTPAPATKSPAPQTPPAPTTGSDEPEYGGEVTVQAPPRGATRRTLAGDDMRRVPGTRGDAFRAIESLPGVSRAPAGEGEPLLRGTSGNESSVQLDGATIPLLYHFGGLTSVVHSRLLERVDVYPSNFSVRYGRVLGGVVDAKTRNPRSDGFHAVLDLSLLDSSALVEAPISDRSAVALAARRSNLDFYFASFVPDDAYAVIAAPVYWDYQALFVHALSPRHELRVLGYGSRDRIELLLNEPVESDPTLRGSVGGALEFHRLSLQARSGFAGGVRQDVSLTLGHVRLGQVVGESVDADLSVLNVDGRGEWQVPFGRAASLTLGFDVVTSFSKGSYRGSRPPQLEGDPRINEAEANQAQVQLADRFSNLSPGAYVELPLTPAHGVLLSPGLRVDHFRALKRTTLDPRLTARLLLFGQTTLKGGVGLFTQEPLYFETLAGIGNPDRLH
ncbi:MAG TPA: TonB-dependent receptor plug domain-containing protein, partial [Polyangiaceae bacterium]|nr:TonB-dependent receptor plug domain-containing protein [Polyangiaceae bacterium]